MTHYSRLSKVVIDVPPADHDRELAFWSAAAGLPPLPPFENHPEYHGAALHGQEFWLLVQRLDQGSARVHIDIHTDDLAAEIARLEELGAQRVQQVDSWQVMLDPAGMLFCVIPEPPGDLNDTNAHRWDLSCHTIQRGRSSRWVTSAPACAVAYWASTVSRTRGRRVRAGP